MAKGSSIGAASAKGPQQASTRAAEKRKSQGVHEKFQIEKVVKSRSRGESLSKSAAHKNRSLQDTPYSLQDYASAGALLVLVAGVLAYWTTVFVQSFA